MFYKVVTVQKDKLVSAFVCGTPLSQEYKIDEFVFCKDGFPFMVFDNFSNAVTFASRAGFSPKSVFQCETVNHRYIYNKFVDNIKANNLDHNINYDLVQKQGRLFTPKNCSSFLNGTVFCDGVRLRKQFV